MWKLMVSEFAATLMMTIGLVLVIKSMPSYSGIESAIMVWLTFVLPMSVSNIIWGGDKKSDMANKIAIIIGYRLVILLIAGYILGNW